MLLNNVDLNLAWRIGFLLGPVIGLVIWGLRRHLPESPRWLIMDGREAEAEENISRIERAAEDAGQTLPPLDDSKAIEIRPAQAHGYLSLLRVLFRLYPARL